MGKKITEIKATCKACGNVYYFGKNAEMDYKFKKIDNFGKSLENAGTDMMCCGGCLPAAFAPKKQKDALVDPAKCPKCGSKAITKEKVTHEV